MMTGYDILYNLTNDVWSIYKIPSKDAVKVDNGKYGILVYRDIHNKIIRIDIPEPDILLGINIEDIKQF